MKSRDSYGNISDTLCVLLRPCIEISDPNNFIKLIYATIN